MKSTVLPFLISLFFFNYTTANAQQQQIEWLTDFKIANKIAVENAKPILLDFTASWCKPCREMDRDFWARADVIELSRDFVCVKIDLEQNPKVADKFGVSSLPNVIMTDSWNFGLNFHRGFGINGKEEIIEKLRAVPKDFGEIKEANKTLASDKKNLNALWTIAEFYQRRNFCYLSSDFYKRLLPLEKNRSKLEILMLNLGSNYLQIGWKQEARDILEKFQKEFPNSPQIEKVNRDLLNL